MNGLAQARHIARKDLREFRWMVLLYLVLVVVATAHASSMGGQNIVLDLSMFFVAIAGMLLVATLVQADAPGRVDAFWSTHPFLPFAVLVAKVLLAAIVVLGVGLVGQAIALGSNGVHGTAILGRLSASAGIYGEWLLTAMVIAALTRDLKSFIVALVCIPIALAIINLASASLSTPSASSSIFSSAPTETPAAPATFAWWWLGIIGCGAVLLWVYHARDVRRSIRALGIVIGACGLLTTGFTLTIAPPKNAPRSVSRAAIVGGFNSADPKSMTIRLRASHAPAGQRLTLLNSNVTLTLRDGATVRVGGPGPLELGVTHPDLKGVRWVTPAADTGHAEINTTFSSDIRAQQAMGHGVMRLALSGRLLASIPHVRGSLPLAKGATLARDGQRTEIASWSYASGDAILELRTKAIARDEEAPSFPGWTSAVVYALVNDARHEALPLRQGRSASSQMWFVLPGTSASSGTDSLTSRTGLPSHLEARDEAWFRDARLVVIDWVPLGGYPVNAEWAP